MQATKFSRHWCEKLAGPTTSSSWRSARKRTVVEYALRESNKPIGVAAYRMVSELPQELRNELPGPEQVAKLLQAVMEE